MPTLINVKFLSPFAHFLASSNLPTDVLWGSVFVTYSWGRNEYVTNGPQRTSAGKLGKFRRLKDIQLCSFLQIVDAIHGLVLLLFLLCFQAVVWLFLLSKLKDVKCSAILDCYTKTTTKIPHPQGSLVAPYSSGIYAVLLTSFSTKRKMSSEFSDFWLVMKNQPWDLRNILNEK